MLYWRSKKQEAVKKYTRSSLIFHVGACLVPLPECCVILTRAWDHSSQKPAHVYTGSLTETLVPGRS
jgi:hypothetical protein